MPGLIIMTGVLLYAAAAAIVSLVYIIVTGYGYTWVAWVALPPLCAMFAVAFCVFIDELSMWREKKWGKDDKRNQAAFNTRSATDQISRAIRAEADAGEAGQSRPV